MINLNPLAFAWKLATGFRKKYGFEVDVVIFQKASACDNFLSSEKCLPNMCSGVVNYLVSLLTVLSLNGNEIW